MKKLGSRSKPLGGAGGPAGVRGKAPRGGRTCKVKGRLVEYTGRPFFKYPVSDSGMDFTYEGRVENSS
jgi:hypothetical protein